jgi:hypothetical protein
MPVRGVQKSHSVAPTCTFASPFLEVSTETGTVAPVGTSAIIGFSRLPARGRVIVDGRGDLDCRVPEPVACFDARYAGGRAKPVAFSGRCGCPGC